MLIRLVLCAVGKKPEKDITEAILTLLKGFSNGKEIGNPSGNSVAVFQRPGKLIIIRTEKQSQLDSVNTIKRTKKKS